MAQKIMLVDDSSMMRSIIKNFANKTGKELEFIEAANGDEAVSKYDSEKPELVFMDIMMPGSINGIEAARKIKEKDNSAKIVMCTSVKQETQDKEAQDIGVNDYITKPFNSDQVIEVINRLL